MKNNNFKFTLLIFSLITCILIYTPGLPGGFIHDDYPNIVLNTALHVDSLDPDTLISASFSTTSGALRRPISMFSFAINHYFTQLNPLYFKVVNIIIHTLNGLALFFLSKCLLNCYRKIHKKNITANQVFYLSLFTSFAWLVSPINLTSVLYIVQRMTSLSALFSVLGLYLYMVGRQSMIFRSNLNIPVFFASAMMFILSIFCKENGVLNILYILCIEIFILHFESNAILNKKHLKIIFLTIIVLPLMAILAWITIDPSYITKGYDHRSYSLGERALTQFRVIVFYLKQIFVPNNTALGLFHDDFMISKSLTQPLTTIASALFLLLLAITAIAKSKKYSLFAFGIFFYFISHLLESTVINLEIMYEHRNYIGSFGIIFAVVSTTFLSINKKENRKLALTVGCIWLLAISFTTMSRAQQWESSLSLAYYEALHHPKSSRANFYLGRTYANLSLMNFFDEKEKALQSLENAMKLSKTEISGETVAMRLAGTMNIPAKQEWIDSLKNKIKSNPINHNIVGGFSELNKCLETDCAIDANKVFSFYQIALSNKLPCPNSYRSDILTLYAGFSTNYMGDFAIAYNAAKEAVSLTPEVLQYRINFISILNAMGKFEEAENELKYVEKNDKFSIFTKKINELRSNINPKKIESKS